MNHAGRNHVAEFWRDSAADAWKTAEVLYGKHRYAHSLFFCHLALEKNLKALVVSRSGVHPPYTHDLRTLAEKAGLMLSKRQEADFDTIGSFNMNARYDTVKRAFNKRATASYTRQWFAISRDFFLWIGKEFQKK